MRTFPGGSVRDDNNNKPRYDLIPPKALERVAIHYATGADKYGPDNWLKGEGMPRQAFIESAFRHFEAMRQNKRDEDHVAACIWNLMAIAHFESVGRD